MEGLKSTERDKAGDRDIYMVARAERCWSMRQ